MQVGRACCKIFKVFKGCETQQKGEKKRGKQKKEKKEIYFGYRFLKDISTKNAIQADARKTCRMVAIPTSTVEPRGPKTMHPRVPSQLLIMALGPIE